MKNWYRTIIIVALAKGSICFGDQILLAPATTSPAEYNAALLSYPDRLSPIDHHLKKTPTIQSLEKLADRFSRAEQSLVNAKNLETARENYKKVLELEQTDDWDEGQRRVFLICYLRLLQMNKSNQNSSERATWIERSLFYLSQVEAPRDLIPPPVFREIEMKSDPAQSSKVLFPEKISKKYPQVLIQGKIYDTNKTIKIPHLKGSLRWTFLSQFFEPQTVITNSYEVEGVKLKPMPFVARDCANLKVTSSRFSEESIEIYQPLHCSSSKKALSNKDRVKPKEVSLPVPIPQPDHHWKMTKKHWIWIGVGTLATAIIASQLNQNKETQAPGPTETYGF